MDSMFQIIISYTSINIKFLFDLHDVYTYIYIYIYIRTYIGIATTVSQLGSYKLMFNE